MHVDVEDLQDIVSEKRKLQDNVSSLKLLEEIKKKNTQEHILYMSIYIKIFFW